ncbi:pyridoxal phosphate-dependent aminotransferase [Rhizobium sp. ZPR3]|uniref:Aminotransferase n=2 Tax=unclassified Rhizobium TaxID=2613769 RepID=A0AAU7SQZ6_9HYPH
MKRFESRNGHFDRLVANADLRWMGQNTNHVPAHPAVFEAMQKCIRDEGFHIYAPPLGFEALRQGIIDDLGLPGLTAMVTDGAVEALYHACHTLLQPGDEFVTTDPTWNWPMAFARSKGAEVKQVPIYGEEYGYRLSAERLAAAITPKTKIVYLVDPNNPLGTACTAEEISTIVDVVKKAGAYLIHDCTYRDFAYDHTLAAKIYPEKTLTIYSFSKWSGLAGLRVGAVISNPDLIEALSASPPNNLGSNIVSQHAAIAALSIKKEWFPKVLQVTRDNQKVVKDACDKIDRLVVPVFPSNGNFLVVETQKLGIAPEALVAAYQNHNIMIRQGAYHTPKFGDRFIKVSVSVPQEWAEEFAHILPQVIEEARTLKIDAGNF